MIRKLKSGRYQVDIRPGSAYGKRIRRSFPTRNEAQRFEAWATAEAIQEPAAPWNPKEQDRRRLSQLVERWYQGHGRHLKDGNRRRTALLTMADELGDMPARDLTPAEFLAWRDRKSREGMKPKTLNNLHGYLSSVFNELHRIDVIDYPSPIGKVRPIKVSEQELAYLLEDEIDELLEVIRKTSKNPHVLLITRICLATGCRWSEAENLTRRRVQHGRCYFVETKSGRNRAVPIDWRLERDIQRHLREHRSFGTSTISAFRRALDKTDIQLPPGQAAHVLRHTFASHFMMNGGNILTLQQILGHADIKMTMRYAHLAPEHLEDALRLNPLNRVGHLLDTSGDSVREEKQKTPDESGV